MHRLIAFLLIGLLAMGNISDVAASDIINIFELEVVPLSELAEDPAKYDSTMAYRKISVVGNISEIDKNLVIIVQEGYELKVEITDSSLFTGFNIGDGIKLTGEFRDEPLEGGLFYPKYVLHYPTVQVGDVEIKNINSNPSDFNGKYVTVTGNITEIKATMGEYMVYLSSPETGQTLRVSYYGATDLLAGTTVSVTGLINGNILYSEQMGVKRSPLSISTFIPGFTGLWTLFILGLLVIYMKHE